jgi:hypothetical protein
MRADLCGGPVRRGFTGAEKGEELLFQLVVCGNSDRCNYCHTAHNLSAGNKILKIVINFLKTLKYYDFYLLRGLCG